MKSIISFMDNIINKVQSIIKTEDEKEHVYWQKCRNTILQIEPYLDELRESGIVFCKTDDPHYIGKEGKYPSGRITTIPVPGIKDNAIQYWLPLCLGFELRLKGCTDGKIESCLWSSGWPNDSRWGKMKLDIDATVERIGLWSALYRVRPEDYESQYLDFKRIRRERAVLNRDTDLLDGK